MIRLTVFAGANEIGGNKILLDDGAARLLLDFGISYARRGRFFEEYLKPRTAAGLTDLLVTGVLPQVTEFYRCDLLALGGRANELVAVRAAAAQVVPGGQAFFSNTASGSSALTTY